MTQPLSDDPRAVSLHTTCTVVPTGFGQVWKLYRNKWATWATDMDGVIASGDMLPIIVLEAKRQSEEG